MNNNQELKIEYIPLNEIKKWKANPKEHDIGQIYISIDTYGFRDPIAINKTNMTIEEGHGRIEALLQKQKNKDGIPLGIKLNGNDWLVPVMFFDDDEITQSKYAIMHNKSVELGGWNSIQLIEVLKDIATIDDLGATGFDGDDLDFMINDNKIDSGKCKIIITYLKNDEIEIKTKLNDLLKEFNNIELNY